jgi:hypothetical protein
VFIKTIAVAAVDRGDVQDAGIVQGLLDARFDRMPVIFGLDNGQGDIGLVVKDVIGPFALTSNGQVTFHINAPIGKRVLFPNLGQRIPAGFLQSGLDVFAANVSFRQVFFRGHWLSLFGECIVRSSTLAMYMKPWYPRF